MGGFIIGVVVVLVLWAVFSMKSRAATHKAFNVLDEAEDWFIKAGIKSSSVQFSSYNDSYLTKNSGATVLVGMGEKIDGNRVGFALEVIQGSGVVESVYIEPYGIASHHKKAAHIARMNGKYLIDALQEMALHHRLEHIN